MKRLRYMRSRFYILLTNELQFANINFAFYKHCFGKIIRQTKI